MLTNLSNAQLNQLKGVLIPHISIKEWILRYNLSDKPLYCTNCNMNLSPSFPIATKKSRGYVFENCKCNISLRFKLSYADKNERENFKKLLKY